jgi:hypothetical protein
VLDGAGIEYEDNRAGKTTPVISEIRVPEEVGRCCWARRT